MRKRKEKFLGFSVGGAFYGYGSISVLKFRKLLHTKSGWDRLYLGTKIDIVIIEIQKLRYGFNII